MYLSVIGASPGESVIVEFSNGCTVTVDVAVGKSANFTIDELKCRDISPDSIIANVFTHFDSDHIRGAAELCEYSPSSRIFIPSYWRASEFKRYVSSGVDEIIGQGAGITKEISKFFDYLTLNKSRVELATENKVIYPRAGSSDHIGEKMTVLAPSAEKESQFIEALGKAAFNCDLSELFSVVANKRNDTSVCFLVEDNESVYLLPGDLENKKDKEIDRIAQQYLNTDKKFQFMKMAHHGSKTSFSEELKKKWDDKEIYIAITPFPSSNPPLPRVEALEYLDGVENSWLTCGKQTKIDREVRMTIRNHPAVVPIREKRPGIIRFMKGESDEFNCIRLVDYFS